MFRQLLYSNGSQLIPENAINAPRSWVWFMAICVQHDNVLRYSNLFQSVVAIDEEFARD